MVDVFDFFNLYVLELQENKWFLHYASPSNDEFLWTECSAMFPFVNKYSPVKTFETIAIQDIFQIDYYVKKYMSCYGIENVRGGSYSNETLDTNTITFLQTELDANKNDYFNRQVMIDNIWKKYGNIITIDDRKKQIEYIRGDIKKYRDLKQLIKLLSADNKINRELIDDLEWIYSRIVTVCSTVPEKLSKTDGDRYKEIMDKFKIAKNVFVNVLEKPLRFDNMIALNTPEFVFDSYFYHSHNDFERIKCINNIDFALSLFQCFEYMCYSIINRLDEFIFDLSTYDTDYEYVLVCSAEYLENMVA